MIDKETRNKIIRLMRREVVPALGCTEPAAVALCVAKATSLLGSIPHHLDLRLSGNIIKNALGVGIPGTGMIGLPIAVALGALIGREEYGLEVLRDVSPAAVEEGKRYISEGRVSISLHENPPSNLHIEVTAGDKDGKESCAIISGAHTRFVYLADTASVILDKRREESESHGAEEEDINLNLRTVYDFATTSPLEEIDFILEAARLNKAAAEVALSGNYGHSLGATIRRRGTSLFGDSPLDHMMSYTSAACDARMGGAQIAVMSNSGSGNQGICATMPVVSYAEDIDATREQLVRALTLSHLTSIYIKQSLGRLSALCGCVVASTGASSGLTLLMGGGYEEVAASVKNMIANLTGMICDGAKPSCSMKISSGVSTALMSAMLAMEGHCVSSAEGIVSDDVDETIHNLTSIGREAMLETDRLVLSIMTCKSSPQ